MIVVPVLITSCQVFEKWNRGPVAIHNSIISMAMMKAAEEPVALVTFDENFSNNTEKLFFDFMTIDLKMNC